MDEGSKAPVWILVVVGGCGCLLVLTAVLGVVAAIVVPNYVDALDKAKQKRTVADVRNVGTAWLSWMVDQIGEDQPFELSPGTVAPERLRELLTPMYISEVPELDGWGHPLEYSVLESEPSGLPVVQIRSPGRDGFFEQVPEDEVAFPARDYDRDLVWRDGFFVQFPVASPSATGS
ncbi:MAG TPA: hypothetical protein VMT85_23930 [Thermoanaerobaculia bacterium]|nr:hypothetical protein [Thermoanaerobaculia bacterium]